MIVLIGSGKMDTKVKLSGLTRIWRSKKTNAQHEKGPGGPVLKYTVAA